MITTSTDDATLAEISGILLDVQATQKELARDVEDLTTTKAPTIAPKTVLAFLMGMSVGLSLGAAATAMALGLLS